MDFLFVLRVFCRFAALFRLNGRGHQLGKCQFYFSDIRSKLKRKRLLFLNLQGIGPLAGLYRSHEHSGKPVLFCRCLTSYSAESPLPTLFQIPISNSYLLPFTFYFLPSTSCFLPPTSNQSPPGSFEKSGSQPGEDSSSLC